MCASEHFPVAQHDALDKSGCYEQAFSDVEVEGKFLRPVSKSQCSREPGPRL